MHAIARQDQRESFWDANRAFNVQRRTVIRYIADSAVYYAAAELNRSGLEYPIPMRSPFFGHDLTLRSLRPRMYHDLAPRADQKNPPRWGRLWGGSKHQGRD
jgi:hypothetical protein